MEFSVNKFAVQLYVNYYQVIWDLLTSLILALLSIKKDSNNKRLFLGLQATEYKEFKIERNGVGLCPAVDARAEWWWKWILRNK